MEDHTFAVGQEFPDVKAFRNAIKEAAIAQHFELRIIKSDLIRYFAKCATEGCPWRICAVKLPNSPTFTIRSLEGAHTCGKNAQNGHHQASVDWIVSFIEERLRDNINYKPKDILHDIHKQYGIIIPYKQAWRAKERGLAAIYGSSEEGYCMLPTFCEEIKKTNPGNGQKGTLDAIRRKFPNSRHAFCMSYLSESISKEFKNSRLFHLLWKAAYATTTTVFKEKMAEIEEASPEAAKWIQKFPPSRWALLYFEGTRYGHLSSNIEEFNRWILDALELPIIQVVEQIHNKLMSEFEDRRTRSHSWFSVLAPSAETRMQEVISRASTYQVLRSDEVEFEVISAERSDIVNIGKHSCSCRDWQLYGIPCAHAAAAIMSCRKDVYAFAEKCFTVASYHEAYSEEIYPIPQKIDWNKFDEAPSTLNEDAQVVRPPKFRRPPGRPEKKRICVGELNREKHTVHCSRCNQTGHYKTTCKADIMKGIDSSLVGSNFVLK
ncbi:hypothetical protein GOBAR_AA30529 [Gossypium barbadense]|uniref:SWIM-type domain-containing protein n=1 Tax=Gossypium barbadense TaxID=3634 RepID=A0A2P5WGE0_GOSBA|nr:hypothetical protein GOBAR_AA30529 [Gossypium barbadense]